MQMLQTLVIVAMVMVTKGDNDPCDVADDTPGPHSLVCLQKWWVEGGCKLNRNAGPDKSVFKDDSQNLTAAEYLGAVEAIKWEADQGYIMYRKDCYGHKYSDCNKDDSYGPHKMECLKKNWLKAGCFLNGTASPTRSRYDVEWWNTATVKGMKDDMAFFKQEADKAMSNEEGVPYRTLCYGIRDTTICGDDDTPGPHSTACLLDLWTEAGCLEVGTGSPTINKKHVKWLNKHSVGELRQMMAGYPLRAAMNIRSWNGEHYFTLCYGSLKRSM